MWGGISGIGLAAGPVMGGVAVDLVGWRAIFVVNVPVGALAGWLTRTAVAEIPPRPRSALDLPGQLLAVLALIGLSAGFIQAGARGWADPGTVSILAAALAGAGFLVVERRFASPMLPPGLFGWVAFTAASGVGLLCNFCLYGRCSSLPCSCSRARGLSALAAGLSLLPLPVMVGLNAFGFCSLAMPAMTAVAMHAVPSGQAGVASGVLNAARQTGGALGVALLGSLLGGPGPITSRYTPRSPQ